MARTSSAGAACGNVLLNSTQVSAGALHGRLRQCMGGLCVLVDATVPACCMACMDQLVHPRSTCSRAFMLACAAQCCAHRLIRAEARASGMYVTNSYVFVHYR